MNNNIVQIIPAPDALMDRYNELAFTQEIPDIKLYADSWMELGRQADEQGRIALAEMCFSRGRFYGRQAGGEYIRLIEGSFSELIPVDIPNNMETDQEWFARQERINGYAIVKSS